MYQSQDFIYLSQKIAKIVNRNYRKRSYIYKGLSKVKVSFHDAYLEMYQSAFKKQQLYVYAVWLLQTVVEVNQNPVFNSYGQQ